MAWNDFCYLMEPLASSIFLVLNLDRIPLNLSFVSLFNQLMFYYQYLHCSTCISGITHYVSKYKKLFKISFQCSLKLILIKKFHGNFYRVLWNFLKNIWTTPLIPWNFIEVKPQNLKFHGIPWNFVQIQHSMEFYGTFSILPSSMEFHRIPWNLWFSPKK